MPNCSIAFTSDASVYRAGGCVKCCEGLISIGQTFCRLAQLRQKLIFAGDAGNFHEAVEDKLAAGGAEERVAGLRVGGERDGGLIELRRRHLAGDESPPDQIVKA